MSGGVDNHNPHVAWDPHAVDHLHHFHRRLREPVEHNESPFRVLWAALENVNNCAGSQDDLVTDEL